MNDTLSVKKILTNTIDAGELDSTVRSFPRVASPKLNDALRQSLHVGALSPTVIRVAHTPRSKGNTIQRSLFSLQQTLTRLDVGSNPIGSTSFKAGLTSEIPSDVTLAEYREGVALLIGALLENDGAMITAIYNGEL